MPTFEERDANLWATYAEASNREGQTQEQLDQLFDQYVLDKMDLLADFNHPPGPPPRRKPK